MRVVHFNEHLAWTGGVETYLLHLLPLLESQGIDNTFVFARGDHTLAQRTIHLPEISQFGNKWDRIGYEKTRELLNELRPDVAHIHRTYNLGVIRACLDFGPTVVTCHDYLYLCPAGSFFHRRTRTICRRKAGWGCLAVTILRHCMTLRPAYAVAYLRRVRQFTAWRDRFAFVLCPSDYVRSRLLELSFSPLRTVTLPYFCPISPLAEPRPLPPTPTVLFLGRIRPIKGVDVFVRALGLLPNVKGLIVGDVKNGTRNAILTEARRCGCEDRLEVRPWAGRNEICSLFERVSIFGFPSIWPETLGIVGLEAMACGVPVVASDVGGVRQWLRHGINGLLVEANNPEAFADAVQELLGSPEQMMQMGRAGIATIRASYLPEHHVAKLSDIYREAIGARAT